MEQARRLTEFNYLRPTAAKIANAMIFTGKPMTRNDICAAIGLKPKRCKSRPWCKSLGVVRKTIDKRVKWLLDNGLIERNVQKQLGVWSLQPTHAYSITPDGVEWTARENDAIAKYCAKYGKKALYSRGRPKNTKTKTNTKTNIVIVFCAVTNNGISFS